MGQIGAPTGALVGGVAARSIILQDYVFQSGISAPEVSNILSYKYPQYYVTALLDRIGASAGIAQDTWSWFTMDRTRQSGTVSSISISTSNVTFEVTEFDYNAGADLGYAVVGDVFRAQSGATGRVTASVVSTTLTNKQKITLASLDGSTWTADQTAGTGIANASVIGHVFSSFEEGSSAPNGRTYLPTEDYNRLTIMRRSFKISGSEFTNKTYIGDGGAWYFEQENIEMKEFARDKEGLVMFGVLGSSGTTRSSRGIWDWANSEGVQTTFAAATGVTETDIQDTLTALLVEGGSDRLLGLCGSTIYTDAQRALKDYHISGSINYGGFGGNQVGLDVQSYRFAGKTLDLVYYSLFDDSAMVPFAGTASSSEVDFANTMLVLDMGTTDKGQPLISLKYKELNGQSRKFIHGYETGMMSPEGTNGGHVSNGDDSFSVHYICEVGPEVHLANRMAIIRSVS